jgi:acyl-CoA synthetase (AMP-forming)/AMP-acid ligase II
MFTTIRIVNAAGQTLPAGEIGEIVVRGPTVMAGYYDEPDATRQALRNGELYTGDMGFMDEAGDLWLVDRRADLIVTGGENVYPAEVENTLRHHPAVVDVCVVGVPDPEWGQRVAAAVALQPQATVDPVDLMDFARSYLAGYKVPRLIKFVSTLPLTASGKVRRVQVRQKFLEDG